MADVGFIAGMRNATQSVKLLHGSFGQIHGLVIALGTNDWSHSSVSVSSFSSAYGAFVQSIPPGIHVLCMSPTWRSGDGQPNTRGETLDDYRAATRAVCESRGATYLDGKDVIPNDPAYFFDGLHPNERGHRAMSSVLARRLREIGWTP
jgi:lysophospholipase L1-like esterase